MAGKRSDTNCTKPNLGLANTNFSREDRIWNGRERGTKGAKKRSLDRKKRRDLKANSITDPPVFHFGTTSPPTHACAFAWLRREKLARQARLHFTLARQECWNCESPKCHTSTLFTRPFRETLQNQELGDPFTLWQRLISILTLESRQHSSIILIWRKSHFGSGTLFP